MRMENHLERRQWLVDDFSAADLCLLPYTALAPEGGFDLAQFPAVSDWISRASDELHVQFEGYQQSRCSLGLFPAERLESALTKQSHATAAIRNQVREQTDRNDTDLWSPPDPGTPYTTPPG